MKKGGRVLADAVLLAPDAKREGVRLPTYVLTKADHVALDTKRAWGLKIGVETSIPFLWGLFYTVSFLL